MRRFNGKRLMLSWQGLLALRGSNLTKVAFANSGKIFAIVLALLISGASLPCFGQTNYYVDPDYTGGARNGNASNPWHSLFDTVTNTPWTVINTALASGPVNVYFSARKAASDTNQTSTIEIAVERTDTSTNVLTLDGNSKYNTNISFPSWTSYSGNS